MPQTAWLRTMMGVASVDFRVKHFSLELESDEDQCPRWEV